MIDKILEYLQITQVAIVYTTIKLYNFIEMHFRKEDNIYLILIEIFDNAESNNGMLSIQLSLIEINNSKNKMATKI